MLVPVRSFSSVPTLSRHTPILAPGLAARNPHLWNAPGTLGVFQGGQTSPAVGAAGMLATRRRGMLESNCPGRTSVRDAARVRPLEILCQNLFPKMYLLVLDNFEHGLDAVPEVVDLLRSCPDLCALVTSRALDGGARGRTSDDLRRGGGVRAQGASTSVAAPTRRVPANREASACLLRP
jgi:hypothetical protein